MLDGTHQLATLLVSCVDQCPHLMLLVKVLLLNKASYAEQSQFILTERLSFFLVNMADRVVVWKLKDVRLKVDTALSVVRDR